VRIVILRGLPGSGKSAFAKLMFPNQLVVSADDYFMKDGVYRFDASRLGVAHARCLQNAEDLVFFGAELVVVDNCNAKLSHMKPYLDLAEESGSEVQVFRMRRLVDECVRFNQHNVPTDVIRRKWCEFESYKGEIYVSVKGDGDVLRFEMEASSRQKHRPAKERACDRTHVPAACRNG
jgi:predicted kinase